MAKTVDPLSPAASPSAVRKTGVRRVNNLPLIIAIFCLALFAGLIAWVAVKRSEQGMAVTQDITQTSSKNTDTSAMAQEVIGGYGAGFIPSEAPVSLPTATEVPINPAEELPLPLRDNVPPIPVDPDEQQIRLAKRQQFQDAVNAKTALSLPSPQGIGSVTRTQASQTRENMVARIAEARHQADSQRPSDLTAAYQAQLANSASSLDRNDVNAFGAFSSEGDRWMLDQKVQTPCSPFELRAGGVIPGVMISGVNSDLPGQIMGQVSQNVYDTATGKHLLIPQGTRLIGSYSSDVGYGQSAVLIAWQRLVFPDGKALDISTMPGADSAGYAGFRDQVNNHYFRIFASAFLLSGVTAGISYSQDRNNKGSGGGSNNNNNQSSTVSGELSQALGQQLGQVTSQMIAKNMNIAPTLEIRPGYRFNIIVVKDLMFSQPFQPFKQ